MRYDNIAMFDLLIPKLIRMTTKVGDMIMSLYENELNIKIKSNKTPFTIADRNAHKIIVKTLSKLTPNTPIISEESEIIEFSERSKWYEYWIIDPLDGTRDFLKQTDEFCICIAYIKKHKPIFGMIYAPPRKTHYYTTDANKVFKQQKNIIQPLNVHPNHNPLRIVIGHWSSHNKQLKDHLNKYSTYKLSQLGSALKFCAIAEGKYDYYPKFGPCSEWDTAAGVCILQNAGGSVVNQNEKPLSYNTKNDLTSPIFFASNKP